MFASLFDTRQQQKVCNAALPLISSCFLLLSDLDDRE